MKNNTPHNTPRPKRSSRKPSEKRPSYPARTPSATQSSKAPEPGSVRIMAGHLKGRVVDFPAIADLRPTGSRIRETLFNWLTPLLPQARCLDLFAGSGILGLEALSRGAKEVAFVEQNAVACQKIMSHVINFGVDKSCKIFASTAQDFLGHRQQQTYDVVFLDPPFEANLIALCAQYLEQRRLLSKTAYIYVEASRDSLYPPVPANWAIVQSQTAGNVAFYLLKRKEH